MKFILVLACLALYLAHIQAEICKGRPNRQDCNGGRHSGHSPHGCRSNSNYNMWYWNGRECLSMPYHGCGGNNNRYCTKSHCEDNCHRRG
ncbi:male accessory gland serine protease inhibitor-like [Drosophila innubila]|uniref:male accessory gland serine protease inhibitor-like n=1 Tax=Drosophila innubila TaxID=198719 RepID=UPI00148CC92B|nr:male accessory gland serine protease inhibitor-like [Drosophila innubila]